MRYTLDKVLDDLHEELYYQPKQDGDSWSVNRQDTASRFVISRRLHKLPAWHTTKIQATDCSIKKKILLTDYEFNDPGDTHLSLIQVLIANGFELFILTHAGTLAKLERDRCDDRDYLKDFFAKAQFCRKAKESKSKNSLDNKLKAAGETNLERWAILDNFAIAPLYMRDETSNFEYKFEFNPKTKLDAPHIPTVMRVEQLERVKLEIPRKILFDSSYWQELLGKMRLKIYDSKDDSSTLPPLTIECCENKLSVLPNLSSSSITNLNFYSCPSLRELAAHLLPQELKTLKLVNCSINKLPNLSQFPLTQLSLNSIPITTFPELPLTLTELELFDCNRLQELPLLQTYPLRTLKLSNISSMKSFPRLPSSLENLTIIKFGFEVLPNLATLALKKIHLLNLPITSLPELPLTLESFYLSECKNLIILPDLSKLPKLKEINLSNISALPKLPNDVQQLTLNCSDLKLPSYFPVEIMTNLRVFNFTDLNIIRQWPKKMHILRLESRNLKILPDISSLCVEKLSLAYWNRLTKIDKLPATLRILDLQECGSLQALPDLKDYPDLKIINCPPHLLAYLPEEQKPKQPKEHKTSSSVSTTVSLPGLSKKSHSQLNTVTNVSSDTVYKATYTIYHLKNGEQSVIHPTLYRQHVETEVSLTKDKQLVLTKKEPAPDDIIAEEKLGINFVDGFSKTFTTSLKNAYLVEIPLKPCAEWTPLPGMTAQDKISDMVKPAGSKIRYNTQDKQYEICWPDVTSSATHLLQYVFTTHAQVKEHEAEAIPKDSLSLLSTEVTQFLDKLFLEAPYKQADKDFISLHQHIQTVRTLAKTSQDDEAIKAKQQEAIAALKIYLKNFNVEELTADIEVDSDFVRILLQRKGVCFHRAFLFTTLCQYIGVPVRHISNQLHSMGEMVADGDSVDLGGAPVKLDFDPPPIRYQTPALTPAKPAETTIETKRLTQRYNWQPCFSLTHQLSKKDYQSIEAILDDLMQQPKLRLGVKNTAAGLDLYAALGQRLQKTKPGQQIIYIESPSHMAEQWEAFTVNEDGSLQTLSGKLQTLIAEGEGILVINWGGSEFKASEIAAHMSINDDQRMFNAMPVSPKLNVINITTPQTPAEERFNSRVQEFVWPETIARPPAYTTLLSTESSATVEEKKEKTADFLEVDLYDDAVGWQEILHEALDIKKTGYYYTLGKIGEALQAGKAGIKLIDAPWHNADFRAFMLQLKIRGTIEINGKVMTLPPDFIWQSAAAKDAPIPKNLLKQPAKDWKPDVETCDIFYLNHRTFPNLFKQQFLQSKEIETILGGWLASAAKDGKKKQIVLTEQLSPGETRRLYAALAAAPSTTIEWVDLVAESATHLCREIKEWDQLSASGIIETQDPYFVAKHLAGKKDLLVSIYLGTSSESLLETTEDKPSTDSKSSWTFHHQVLEIATALQQGKTVVLYGALSAELYQALEPLLSPKPHLSLFNNSEPQPVTGKLVIVTTPLAYTPILAQHHSQHSTVTDRLLLDAYKQQLSRDFPEEKYPQRDQLIEKILLFYKLADKVTHGEVGTPPLLRLSYHRLRQFLQILTEKPANDNPIKAFFHHDYDHRGENYAYLNVIAKALFGAEEKSQACGVRKTKLANYPNDKNHVWRRINCLNAAAIADLLHLDKEYTPLKQQPDTTALFFQLQSWLKSAEYADIKRNEDPQAKTITQLENALAKQSIVTLKGEPGTGKTFSAQQYANAKGRQAFFGESVITRWLESKAEADKEAVLIIDEVNLKRKGYWNFLIPLLDGNDSTKIFYGKPYTISKHHKVIFTCNPEHYPSRDYHDIVQDSQQISVKSWTRKTLTQYIINPLCKELKQELTTAETAVLENMLTALQMTCQLLAPSTAELKSGQPQELTLRSPITNEELSVRDVQTLMLRWRYHIINFQKKPLDESAYQQAAYEAFMLQWAHRFATPEDTQAFKTKMLALFKPKITKIKDFVSSKPCEKLFKKLPPQYYLASKQREWFITLYENIQLTDHYKTAINPIDRSPYIKLSTLLEGESGLGKTSMALTLLRCMGVTQLSAKQLLASKQTDLRKYAVQFTSGANPAATKELLLKAFHTGCKVVIDELNLDPAIENLLNQLLTGKTPTGETAKVPGFYVIASQNSSKCAGNSPTSAALKNRMNVLTPFTTRTDLVEIAEIALHKQLPIKKERREVAEDVVTDFSAMQTKNSGKITQRQFLQGLPKVVEQQALRNSVQSKCQTEKSVTSTVSSPSGTKMQRCSATVYSKTPATHSSQ